MSLILIVCCIVVDQGGVYCEFCVVLLCEFYVFGEVLEVELLIVEVDVVLVIVVQCVVFDELMIFLLYIEGYLVGMIGVYFDNMFDWCVFVSELWVVYVVCYLCGGVLLLEMVIVWFVECGVIDVYVWIVDVNCNVICFYECVGFGNIGEYVLIVWMFGVMKLLFVLQVKY